MDAPVHEVASFCECRHSETGSCLVHLQTCDLKALVGLRMRTQLDPERACTGSSHLGIDLDLVEIHQEGRGGYTRQLQGSSPLASEAP